jgi:hypothetical protein
MSDRLSELLRQRALMAEHLAWLDREIANVKALPGVATATSSPSLPRPASNLGSETASPASATTLPAPRPSTLPAHGGTASIPPPNVADTTLQTEVIPPETEVILEQYRVTPAAVKQDVRKGCLLYFIGAFVVLGVIVAILYFTIGSP